MTLFFETGRVRVWTTLGIKGRNAVVTAQLDNLGVTKMRKYFLIFLALFMTAGVPSLSMAGDGDGKPKGEAEPECD